MIDARVIDAARLAVGTLTVVPVRPPEQVDRRVGGLAMAMAPAVGAGLGSVAALVLWASSEAFSPWLSAFLAIAVLAVSTRLIHWDGLADLADGLGSGRPAGGALETMRRSDIGPFGVVTVVLVLGLQVGGAAELSPAALVAGAALGRWSLALACRSGVPAARPDGLGTVVAGVVTPLLLLAALVSTAGLVGVTVVAGVPWQAALIASVLVTVWSVAATAFVLRRLGGITGDVLGALVETSTAVALLSLAAWP